MRECSMTDVRPELAASVPLAASQARSFVREAAQRQDSAAESHARALRCRYPGV